MQFSFEKPNMNNFYRSETSQLEFYAMRNGLKISLGDNIFIEANWRVPLKQIQNREKSFLGIHFTFQKIKNFWNPTTRQPPT